MTIGKIEASFVGLCMRDKAALADAIAAGVEPKHLQIKLHAMIYQTCVELWEKGKTPDIVSVCHGVGPESLDTIMEIRSKTPLTQDHNAYIQAVLDGWTALELRDGLTRLASHLAHRGAMEPIGPAVDRLLELALAAKGQGPAIKTTHIRTALGTALASTEKRVSGKGAVCVPSGFKIVDRAIYGFQPGFVYILGARTAVGKTTLAVNMARNAAAAGHKVAYVTVEMSDADLADKMLCREAMLSSGRYLSGDLTDDECARVEYAGAKLAELPILFVEATKPSLEYLASEMTRLVRIERVELVVVDYLQLFEPGGDSRYRSTREEVKTVSARLKMLARSLGVPILVLSQLNRQAPENGEPELIHIAESDQIVRDADVVMLLYYEKEDYWLTIAKNRRGERVRVRLHAELSTNTFSEGTQ